MTDPSPALDELAALLDALEPVHDGDPVWASNRLEQVLRHHLHDPGVVQRVVADLLAQVAHDLGTPIALLNGVLTDTQVLAGEHGLDGWLAEARATPVEWALCATVVRTGQPWTVPDLARELRTADNPLHVVDGLQSYAGVPLRAEDGSVLGALCVLDHRPRDYDARDLQVLAAAAQQALRLLRALPAPRAAGPG